MAAAHDEAEALGRLLDALDVIHRANSLGVKIEPRDFQRMSKAYEAYTDAAEALRNAIEEGE